MKLDLKRANRPLYDANREPALVAAPPLPYLMADGVGDPDGETYRAAVEGLYRTSYAVRAALKSGVEYSVMPLQGRWHGEGFDPDRSSWRWTMMILQPPQATPELVAAALGTVGAKHPGTSPPRFEVFDEGECAQVLHIGPYADEVPTRDRLMKFVAEQGRVLRGSHHEIYLSDPRRAAPEKLKTILRYPVASG
ncbi:GyrI-like domain-containing protein [Phytomonospora sp. NPDC050363]|uniref:GyrI-like domain-containing protein n=1 Tax=Phytomonospora sp. NPDC050363 TaxID=3155642 RepID=UPI0033D1C293